MIANSPLFDGRWYLETYPDVAAAGADPATHFLENGWVEGRDPGPEFATSAYLKANPDVASAGINPLLHFIEFGQFEGREVRVHRFPPWRRSGVKWDFAPAAPVFRGKVAAEAGEPWLRSYRLSDADRRLFSIGDCRVAYVESPTARSELERAFRYLRCLSGYDGGDDGASPPTDTPAPAMLDAWYVNQASLRTRWECPRLPVVIRAFQHDPILGGELAIVADEIVNSTIDFVDLSLRDPYAPLLVICASADGVLAGFRLLPFPSYCRGGLHYSELLALTPEGSPPDPIGTGLAQARQLLAARDDPRRMIQSVFVDPAGADEGSPLLQPRFRGWLERVAKIGVDCERTGRTLTLASDMIPTVGVLTECVAGKANDGTSFHPLLVASPDPSQPSLLVQLPPDAPECLARGAPGYPSPWPRSTGIGDLTQAASTAAAIRFHRRDPSDAELLVPVARANEPEQFGQPSSITWIFTMSGDSADLWESARAISLQSGELAHVIGVVGQIDQREFNRVAALFRGRVRSYSDLAAAVRAARTDFVAHISPGVILHDNGSTEELLSMLREPGIESVSCTLVKSEKRGKSWQVSIVDAGEVRRCKRQSAAGHRGQMSLLWRSTYPVAPPSRDFWLARTFVARDWFRAKASGEQQAGMHLCTTLVTASISKRQAKLPRAVGMLPSPAENSASLRTLFG